MNKTETEKFPIFLLCGHDDDKNPYRLEKDADDIISVYSLIRKPYKISQESWDVWKKDFRSKYIKIPEYEAVLMEEFQDLLNKRKK